MLSVTGANMFFFLPAVGPLTIWDVVGGALLGAGLAILTLLFVFLFSFILVFTWLVLVAVGTWLTNKLYK